MAQEDFFITSECQELSQKFLEDFPQTHRLEEIADQILPSIGQQLQCDRIFLYVRSPYLKAGRVPFCWRRHEDIPLIYNPHWKAEPATLADEDPLFAAALNAHPSIFVEDVETASPQVLNQDFEQRTFGHRALVHAHLCLKGRLWGILQPCVFGRPQAWTEGDRRLIGRIVGWFTPLSMEYVNRNLHHPSDFSNTNTNYDR